MTFVGASLGLKHARHIMIATFGARLPARWGAALRVAVWLLVLAMLAVLMVQGVKVMGAEGRSQTIPLPVELPRSLFYSLPLALSGVSMALTAVYRALKGLPILAGRRPARAAA